VRTAAYLEAALRADPACRLLVLWRVRWRAGHVAQMQAWMESHA
jgi:hypothetical protein